MITPELMFGLGVLVIAIGFGFCRRARDTASGAWDQAGSLLQIVGALVILLGCALMIPRPSNAIAGPVVATQPLSAQRSGLHHRLPRSSAAVTLGGETQDLPDSQKP